MRWFSHTSYNSFNKWTKISSFEIDIFDFKMMVESGLEFFILKFTQPFQSCCCPVQKKSAKKGWIGPLKWKALWYWA